jgi:hypothetical protein
MTVGSDFTVTAGDARLSGGIGARNVAGVVSGKAAGLDVKSLIRVRVAGNACIPERLGILDQ